MAGPDYWGQEYYCRCKIFVFASSLILKYCRYILLKERNMLLTMEHAYNEAVEQMPNEERIDKVSIQAEFD